MMRENLPIVSVPSLSLASAASRRFLSPTYFLMRFLVPPAPRTSVAVGGFGFFARLVSQSVMPIIAAAANIARKLRRSKIAHVSGAAAGSVDERPSRATSEIGGGEVGMVLGGCAVSSLPHRHVGLQGTRGPGTT